MNNEWKFYTSKEIKPSGWLRRQLEIQAGSLSGNLDKMWRDVRDSKWIGGCAEGWERVPYWLDGFIPLAYLLDDEDMISRAQKYIDAIISFQREDGWICPCTDEEIPEYDTWAVQLISKVLTVYYECSGDERIPDVIYKTLRNYYELLADGRIHLFNWGKARWFETFIAVNFVYERYNEEWLVDLGRILKEQGTDYSSFVKNWERPLNKWTFETHIVNIGMMLKEEAVCADILGEKYSDKAEKLRTILDKYNGTPVCLFTGDECLSGLSPIQGTELCAVAEQMYSYEILYAYTGDKKWKERLEILAFNALPATISDDMWTHQYVQMSNQINCIEFPGKSLFRTNSSESHLFGLEPNYGCCTANFNQAWPKFALSAFMHKDNKILSAVTIPSVLSTENYEIILETDYPFINALRYKVTTSENIVLEVQLPSFCENILCDGKPCEAELCFEIAAGSQREISITFDTPVGLISRPHDLKTVKSGSLIFSIPLKTEYKKREYEKDGVERKFPYCDYELYGKSKWNYAYCSDKFIVSRNVPADIPFSSSEPCVRVKAKIKEIDWGFEDGYDTVCAKIPECREPLSRETETELYPYGCAKLRMTEIPLIK